MVPERCERLPQGEWQEAQPQFQESRGMAGVDARDGRAKDTLTRTASIAKLRNRRIDSTALNGVQRERIDRLGHFVKRASGLVTSVDELFRQSRGELGTNVLGISVTILGGIPQVTLKRTREKPDTVSDTTDEFVLLLSRKIGREDPRGRLTGDSTRVVHNDTPRFSCFVPTGVRSVCLENCDVYNSEKGAESSVVRPISYRVEDSTPDC